jgi:hypothetical protein
MLRLAKESLMQGNAPNGPRAALRLFFFLARTVVRQRLPPHSPLASQAISIAMEIGKQLVVNDPAAQVELHRELMRYSPEQRPHLPVIRPPVVPKSQTHLYMAHPPVTTPYRAPITVATSQLVPPAPIPDQQLPAAPLPSATLVPALDASAIGEPSIAAVAQKPIAQPRYFAESFRTFFELSNPACLLSRAEFKDRYAEQLLEIAEGCKFAPEDESNLLKTYKIAEYFDPLAANPQRLEGVIKIMPKLSNSRKAFTTIIVAPFLSNLLGLRFPDFVPAVFDVLFAAGSSPELLLMVDSVITRTDFSSISVASAIFLIRHLALKLPLPETARLAVIKTARPILLSPAFISGIGDSMVMATLADITRRSLMTTSTAPQSQECVAAVIEILNTML